MSIAGVWCWKSSHTNDGLIPDLHKIKWNERTVYPCFDNDIVTKPLVKQALCAFMQTLASFGAIVRPVYLPDYNNVNKKLGLDDYLMEYGADEFQKLIDKARMPMYLLLDKYITKRDEDFGKKIEYEIKNEHFKDFEYAKGGIYTIGNNYYEISVPKKDNEPKLIAIRKSNFEIIAQREVIHHNLKFNYETEHKVEIITILNGKPTKKIVLSLNNLFEFRRLSEILKTNGIHQYHFKELEYKNIVRKAVSQIKSVLYSFENPGFNVLANSKLWLSKNACYDLNTKQLYVSKDGKSIMAGDKEVCLKVSKGFIAPTIRTFRHDETIDSIISEFPYLAEVKNKYAEYISGELRIEQLIALSLFHNTFETYNRTIEPFLILGTALLSPFVSEIFEKLQGYPIGFAGGESQSGKSNLLITIAALYGFTQNFLKSGNDTAKNLLHNIEYYSKIPVLIQETGKYLRDRLEDFLIKPVYDRTGRGLMTSGEEQNIKAINSTLIIASNDIIHRNLQTSSRLMFTEWKKDNFNKDKARKFNLIREGILSAILPDILSRETAAIIDKINENAGIIEQRKYEIDPRSVNNIALAKTGLDILVELTGMQPDTPALKYLNDRYFEFLENYNEAVSLKDSLDMFLEVFEVLIRDKKVIKNTDWKLSSNNEHLAIYLKSVYPLFKTYFKRLNDNNYSTPTDKDIRNCAKNRGFDTNHAVTFGGSTKKALYIPLKDYEHILALLKEQTGSAETF